MPSKTKYIVKNKKQVKKTFAEKLLGKKVTRNRTGTLTIQKGVAKRIFIFLQI